MGHDGLVVREADNIQIAEHLAHAENIISGEMKSSDVRLLHRKLAHFFEVCELVYHDKAAVACQDHALRSLLVGHLVDGEALVDQHLFQRAIGAIVYRDLADG